MLITATSTRGMTNRVITNQLAQEKLGLSDFLRKIFEWNKITFVYPFQEGCNLEEKVLAFERELTEKGEAKCESFNSGRVWVFKMN